MSAKDHKMQYTLALYNETEKGILVGKEPMKKRESFWLPKSQITKVREKIIDKSQYVVLIIPDWLAVDKGLEPETEGEPFDE